jgi:O-antigen/teichoic acid export membrane protein
VAADSRGAPADEPRVPEPSHFIGLARQTLVYGLSGVAIQAIGVITLPIFARVFTQAEFGVLELGTTLFAFTLALVDAGFSSAAQRSFFDYTASEDEQRRTVISTAFAFTSFVALLAAVVLVLARNPIADWLFGGHQDSGIVVAVAVAIPLINGATFLREAMRLRFRPWSYGFSSFLGSIAATVFSLVAILALDAGVEGFFLGLAFGNGLAALYGFYAVRSDIRPRVDRAELRTMLAYGLPLVPAAVSLWGLALADRILLRKLADLDAVGQYAVANRVSNVLLLAVTGFALAFSPYIMSLYAEDKPAELLVRAQALRYLTILLALGALVLTLFARELITVVAPAFDQAYKAVGPLSLAVVAFGVSSVVISGISYARRTTLLAGIALVAAAVNIGLNFALIPPFGMVGAAFATTAAYSLLALVQYVVAQRLYPTPYEGWKVLSTIALACVAGTLGVVRLEPLALALGVKALALGAFAIVLRLVGIIDGHDVLKLQDLLGKARLRSSEAA